jgi:Carboxypeptidase regulatory-like domain
LIIISQRDSVLFVAECGVDGAIQKLLESAPHVTRSTFVSIATGCRVNELASLVVALALVGCGDNIVVHFPPETPPVGSDRATVTGRIVDASGAAIVGATVTVRATGEHATADGDGAFVIDVPADTTLTLAATAPSMSTTLVPQFTIAPDASTSFTIPLLAHGRITSLGALGGNPLGGAIAILVKSVSGAPDTAAGATVEIIPSLLGTVLYAPARTGMPDPDRSLTGIVQGAGVAAWVVGVQPHVSILTLELDGVARVDLPYSIDDVTWSGTFTVDSGSLTLVTLFTP